MKRFTRITDFISDFRRSSRPHALPVMGAVVAGLSVLSVGVGAASAAPVRWEPFHIEDAMTHEDFCGVPGLTVYNTFETDGRFRTTTHGPDGLSYYVEFESHATDTWTNVATGETATTVASNKYVDHKVTDNGDGTLTVMGEYIGTIVVYNGDGQVIGRAAGILGSFEVIYDHGGTPTDPSDDVFLEFKDLGSAGKMVDFCAAIVPVIG